MKKSYLILSMSLLAVVSCKKTPQQAMGPKSYPIVSVEEKNITAYQSFPASIQGIVNNDVRAKIQGYISQVLVDEGQYVVKGQPLFRLETNMLNENADAARSGIAAAASNVEATRAIVNAAKVEVDKLVPLVKKNIISQVQLQTAQANYSKAQAQLTQAIAAQKQAAANYKSVQANIDYSIIRSPITGVVGRIPFLEGSLVGPSDPTPLTVVSDTKEVYAYFAMNETEYLNFLEKTKGVSLPEKIKNLPMVDLVLANGSKYNEKGRIEAITGQINASTGTIQFRASFPNTQKLLSNGNSGTVKLPVYYNNVLIIPESSTYEQQGIVYAFKVGKDKKVKNTIVDVKERINNVAMINAGLNKGDKVVALGVSSLKDDTEIIPKPIKFDSLIQTIKPNF